MANPFSKGWKYLAASLDRAIDENADPKVQIQQAIDAAKSQHQAILDQAAAVLGNKRQLEMKLNKLVKDQTAAQEKARAAIVAAGDTDRAADLNGVAEVLATQLVTVEQQLEDTKVLYAQAETAAEQAKKQVKESEARLHDQMSQINELAAQADQAALQETTVKAMDSIGQFSKDDSVPTLDAVREKIERRYANALGAQELTEQNISGRMAEISQSGQDTLAAARLAEIRAELGGAQTEEKPKELEASTEDEVVEEDTVAADSTTEVDADDVETVVEEEGTEDGIVEADVEDGDVDKPQEQDEEEAATEAPASSDKADS